MSLRSRLLNFFGITISDPKDKNNPTGKQLLVPANENKKGKDGTYKPIDFPTDVIRAYDYFLQNQQLYNPNRERFELYKSLLFMTRNNGIMNQALQTFITETIEMKEGEKPIQIRAKDRKIEKHFNSWIDSIGFNYNMLNELVYDLVLFGDSFFIHDIDDELGIKEVALIDPFLVRDRLELNLNRIEEIRSWGNLNRNYTNRYRSIRQIIDYIEGKNSKEEVETFLYYKSYLLGFELKYNVSDETAQAGFRALPPWSITHFRLFTTKSEFFPFGRPMFISSLAPFQSYKTTEMLIDMLRVASFPKETVTIKGGDTMTPFDRLQRVDEVRQFIENISPATNNKDNLSINERLYSIEDLFTYDVIDSGVEMDKLGDLEKKLDDLVLSTGIPDTWLIPSRGNGGLGGESAKALLYNNKLFQRRIEAIKSSILEGFSNMYRLHLAITEEFSGEKTEFELFMPVNAEMFSVEKVSQDNDQLRLATDFMNNLGQALGMDRGQSLPIKVVKDIFAYYLPMSDDQINKWVDLVMKKEEEDNEEEKLPSYDGTPAPMIVPTEGSETSTGGKEGTGTFSKPKPTKKKESYSKSVKRFIEGYHDDDVLIREAYFKAKKELGLTNVSNRKYVYYNDSYDNKLKEEFSIYNMIRMEQLGTSKEDKLVD